MYEISFVCVCVSLPYNVILLAFLECATKESILLSQKKTVTI